MKGLLKKAKPRHEEKIPSVYLTPDLIGTGP